MLKLLVWLVCIGTAAVALKPKAKKNSFLYGLQASAAEFYDDVFPDGQISNEMQMGVNMAETDFCKITNPVQQSHSSIFFGATCKAEFVRLYNEEDQCGGVFCNVIRSLKDNGAGFIRDFVAETSDEGAFTLIEEQIVNPIMDYTCRCAMPMMDGWISCKSSIGEAQVFDLLQVSGAFDTSADYLGGETFKNFWVDLIANRIDWENIREMLDRVVSNLCEDNAKDGGKCYSYFYKTATHLYQWYLKSTGLAPSPSKGKDKGYIGDDYPDQCTTFNLDMVSEEYEPSFSDIKDALVRKFCVEDCSGLYQDVLLGCCTASMIQDTGLSDAVVEVADDFAELYIEVYPEEEDEVDGTSMAYLDYAEEVMGMLRNPTCENGVTYDVVPCAECEEGSGASCGAVDGDPCAGLKKKALKKCLKDNPVDGGDDPCAGLSGKKLKKCQKKEKKKNKGQNARI